MRSLEEFFADFILAADTDIDYRAGEVALPRFWGVTAFHGTSVVICNGHT
jgi:hypothetical protein